jgi:hypothetical protein
LKKTHFSYASQPLICSGAKIAASDCGLHALAALQVSKSVARAYEQAKVSRRQAKSAFESRPRRARHSDPAELDSDASLDVVGCA